MTFHQYLEVLEEVKTIKISSNNQNNENIKITENEILILKNKRRTNKLNCSDLLQQLSNRDKNGEIKKNILIDADKELFKFENKLYLSDFNKINNKSEKNNKNLESFIKKNIDSTV